MTETPEEQGPVLDLMEQTLPAATIVVTSLAAEREAMTVDRPGPHVPLVPAGMCHAAPLGSKHTLCGLPTEPLSWFPGLVFAAAGFLQRCQICLARLDHR